MTNGATGKTVIKAIPANSSPERCVLVLQQAAFEAGLQIQGQQDGRGLRVFGINNAVNVTGAAVAVSQFGRGSGSGSWEANSGGEALVGQEELEDGPTVGCVVAALTAANDKTSAVPLDDLS